MPSRRIFLASLITSFATVSTGGFSVSEGMPNARPGKDVFGGEDVFRGGDVFQRILVKATERQWNTLPIGVLMGKIARELEGTPYVANTLEVSPEHESCVVDLTGLDCVTFFETTLGFARMLKKGGRTPADLFKEVRFTRYRGGKLGDYSSRLHYTSDWFWDNQKKGVVTLLSQLPGAETFSQKVGFITSHPESYRQLVSDPHLVPKIKRQEKIINSRNLEYIPMDKLASVEPFLKTGDIVGVCTNQTGLDISHTGLILCDAQGVAHFMDASSKKSKMMVTIEPGPISQTLNWSKNLTGATFARPLEPI